jgi:hypothetical protein
MYVPPSPQVLSILFTFASSTYVVRALLSSLFCVSFGLLHAYAQPMRLRRVNQLQSALLFCLSVVAIINVPGAEDLELALPSRPVGVPSALQRSRDLRTHAELVFGHVFPAASAFVVMVGAKVLAAVYGR